MRTVLIVSACFLLCIASITSVRADEFLFTTTTDFVTGSSSVISLDGSHTVDKDVASIHSDAVCRYYDGMLYVVNRLGGDNIQMLNPSTGFSTIRQFSVGNNSDPHDIVVLSSTKAYVTLYNETTLLIVNPSTGLWTGSIDLSTLADADGLPEMDQMARVGDYVFVTVQRLDRNNFFTPVGLSYVVVIDITTDTIVDSITLFGTNPFWEIKFNPYSRKLYVSCAGFFGVQDFGVEVINPNTLQSEGIVFDEAAAGGDMIDVQMIDAFNGYAIVADASFNTLLISFDALTGNKTGTLFNPGGYVLNDIEYWPATELFLADRTATNPGIRIFDTQSNTQITTNPIDVGLPPFDICFSVPLQTAVNERPLAVTTLGQNYPNPFNPTTTIPFNLERSGHVRLAIYSVDGSLVRTLVSGRHSAGAQAVVWDGRDNASRPVTTGVYFAKLRTEGHLFSRKLVLLK